jgi:HK97 family phage portal protein
VVAIHQAATRCRLRLYRGDDPVTDHPTARLLERPRSGVSQSQGTFIGKLATDFLLRQEAWIGKRRSGGDIVSLSALDADLITAELQSGEPVFSYTEPGGRVVANLTLDDIVPIIGVTKDGLRGVSPIAENREVVELSRSIIDYAAEFWRSGGVPIGLLHVGGGPQADDLARNLADTMRARQSSSDRARMAVLAGNGEVSFEGISASVRDAGWEEAHRAVTADVARILGIWPSTINAESQAGGLSYVNRQQETKNTVGWSLFSTLSLIEQAISLDEDLCSGSLHVRFETDERVSLDDNQEAQPNE